MIRYYLFIVVYLEVATEIAVGLQTMSSGYSCFKKLTR